MQIHQTIRKATLQSSQKHQNALGRVPKGLKLGYEKWKENRLCLLLDSLFLIILFLFFLSPLFFFFYLFFARRKRAGACWRQSIQVHLENKLLAHGWRGKIMLVCFILIHKSELFWTLKWDFKLTHPLCVCCLEDLQLMLLRGLLKYHIYVLWEIYIISTTFSGNICLFFLFESKTTDTDFHLDLIEWERENIAFFPGQCKFFR